LASDGFDFEAKAREAEMDEKEQRVCHPVTVTQHLPSVPVFHHHTCFKFVAV
jgi:hypothetical protein